MSINAVIIQNELKKKKKRKRKKSKPWKIGLVWLFEQINHCRLFNAKSYLYTYIKYIWFGLVGFYSKSTIVGYLMPNPIYTYTLNIYVVHSINFLIIFVQAFKIVVDSWKFTMLLLYIIWDDWPIFMISG